MPLRLRRLLVGIVSAACLIASNASAAPITIDFEDGSALGGQPIANHYSALGVTVNNGVWLTAPMVLGNPPNNFFAGQVGLGVQNGQIPTNSWAFPGTTSPIEISFATALSSVSINAYDVALAGARLRAFDSSGQQVGPDVTYSAPDGTLGFHTLSLTVAGIRSIKLDQYAYSLEPLDGVGWDTLTLVGVPEPSSGVLAIVGILVGLAAVCRRSCHGRAL